MSPLRVTGHLCILLFVLSSADGEHDDGGKVQKKVRVTLLEALSDFVTIGFCDSLLFVAVLPIPYALFSTVALSNLMTVWSWSRLISTLMEQK